MARTSKSYRLSAETIRRIEEIREHLHGLAETRIVENAILRYHAAVVPTADRRAPDLVRAECAQ